MILAILFYFRDNCQYLNEGAHRVVEFGKNGTSFHLALLSRSVQPPLMAESVIRL
jgi:hypothetical protein